MTLGSLGDLAERRQAESEADALSLSKSDTVVSFALQAKEAFKKRNWDQGKKLLQSAKAAIPVQKTLADLLLDLQVAKSRAQARRLVEAGSLTVDGVVARRPDINIVGATSVLFRGVEILPKGE